MAIQFLSVQVSLLFISAAEPLLLDESDYPNTKSLKCKDPKGFKLCRCIVRSAVDYIAKNPWLLKNLTCANVKANQYLTHKLAIGDKLAKMRILGYALATIFLVRT